MGTRGEDTGLSVRVQAARSSNNLLVELRGAADLANHAQLSAALSRVDLSDVDDVHVRLSGLTFCDTRALSHLIAFARQVRDRGHGLTTYGASRTVRKMSRVLDAEHKLNLV